MCPAPVSEFNESVFQCCYLHDFIANVAALGPYQVKIPTLRHEAEVGYDARVTDFLGRAVFFQFKIAQERIAWSKSDPVLPGWHGSPGLELPYRTFDIHSADQHTLMIHLAVSNDAFYVAPTFLTGKELWAHSLAGTVAANCMEFEAGATASVIDDDHRFVFYPTVPWWNFFSTSDGRERAQARFSIDRFVERLEREPMSFAEIVSRAFSDVEGALERDDERTVSSRRADLPKSDIADRYVAVQRALRRAGIEWCIVLRERTLEERPKPGISIRLQ